MMLGHTAPETLWIDLGVPRHAAGKATVAADAVAAEQAISTGTDTPRFVEHLHRLTQAYFAASDALVGRWSVMATVGGVDLTVARALEPHVDALSILEEAGSPLLQHADRHIWGVFAAESAGARLTAEQVGGRWVVDGSKPWCSLPRLADRALTTAWTSPTTRRLFAVRTGEAEVGDDPWVARGLTAVGSPTLTFRRAEAVPVGDDDWYLSRAGFAAGGVRVAAIWFGAAVALGRGLRTAAGRRAVDQIGLMHLGAVEASLHQARAVLADAATRLHLGPSGNSQASPALAIVALHARRSVRAAAEDVLARTAHALGPSPLVRDEHHARRVADLHVYLRQEHAQRDEAALGKHVLDHGGLIL